MGKALLAGHLHIIKNSTSIYCLFQIEDILQSKSDKEKNFTVEGRFQILGKIELLLNYETKGDPL